MRPNVRSMTLTALFAALIAAGAYLRIPMPTIPFTLQTFFVVMAGLLLGAKLGALSAAIYVTSGLIGLPVFTGGGGIGYVLQPTFGYLLGFICGAYITGRIAGKSLSAKRMTLASLAGAGVIYLIGVPYCWIIYTFYIGTGIGIWPLLLHGLLMTAPGDIASCFVAGLLAKRLRPILLRR